MNEKISTYYRLEDKVLTKNDYHFHSHERFEIYYFHRGNCKYLIRDHIYHLQSDDIIIMNGLTLHRANPEPGTTYEPSVVEFSSEWMKPIIDSLNVPELLSPFNKLSNSLIRGVDTTTLTEIRNLIKKLAQLNSNIQNEQMVNSGYRIKEGELSAVLIQLLFKIYELSKLKLNKIPSCKSEKSIHVDRIVNWINQNFSKSITLDCISDSLNISKYYMSRVFKDVTGYTIMQYLMCCRINHAKYLLEIYPDKTILEVALESGFDNSSHFSRFFRKQTNFTPTQYRNRNDAQIKTNEQSIIYQ